MALLRLLRLLTKKCVDFCRSFFLFACEKMQGRKEEESKFKGRVKELDESYARLKKMERNRKVFVQGGKGGMECLCRRRCGCVMDVSVIVDVVKNGA